MTMGNVTTSTVTFRKGAAGRGLARSGARLTRVAIVDDHPMMCSGLAITLRAEPDLDVVATGTTAADVITIAEQHAPDVIIVDLDLGRGCGLDAIRRIAKEYPMVHTLVLTAHDDLLHTHRAFEAGARGFIAKGVSARELSGAVRAVVAGGRFVTIPQTGADKAARAITLGQPDMNVSPKETMILSAVAAGKSNLAIATELGVPERTIRSHVANVMKKLNLKRRVLAAIAAAHRRN